MSVGQENLWNRNVFADRKVTALTPQFGTIVGFLAFLVAYYFAYRFGMSFTQAFASPFAIENVIGRCLILATSS